MSSVIPVLQMRRQRRRGRWLPLKWWVCRQLYSQARNFANWALRERGILSVIDVFQNKTEQKATKMSRWLFPKAGKNCQCQSQHCAFALHVTHRPVLFLCPCKEDKCLVRSCRLHWVPFFINIVSQSLVQRHASSQQSGQKEDTGLSLSCVCLGMAVLENTGCFKMIDTVWNHCLCDWVHLCETPCKNWRCELIGLRVVCACEKFVLWKRVRWDDFRTGVCGASHDWCAQTARACSPLCVSAVQLLRVRFKCTELFSTDAPVPWVQLGMLRPWCFLQMQWVRKRNSWKVCLCVL